MYTRVTEKPEDVLVHHGSPRRALKKLVPKCVVSVIVMAPASTGITAIRR